MTPWAIVPLAASFLMFSCDNSLAPRPEPPPAPAVTVTIHGTIRLSDGTPACPAVVTVGPDDQALAIATTDTLGHYQVTLAASRDSVRVYAREECPPGRICGVLHYDWVMTVADQDRNVNLALVHVLPFPGAPAATVAYRTRVILPLAGAPAPVSR